MKKILRILLILFAVLLFCPVKFAVKDIPKEKRSEEQYVISETTATGASWAARKQDNGETVYFLRFNDKEFEDFLPRGINVTDNQGLVGNNKFVIYGKKYNYNEELDSYSFDLNDWDIMYPIERKPTVYALFASSGYITPMDYILG